MDNIRVYLKVKAVMKGKRKASIQLLHIGDLHHEGPIDADMVVEWERKAWRKAQDIFSKFKNSGSINFHKMNIDGDMLEVYMQPIKSVLVMSDLGIMSL